MRKIYILPILFMLVLNLWGCYEDKGNYEYGSIDELIVELPITKSVSIGDVIKVEPKLSLKSGSEDFSGYEFKWTLNGESRPEWNRLNFEMTATKKIDVGYLILEAVDKSSGIKFYNQLSVSIKGAYNFDEGYVILSEKNGESVISLLKITDPQYSEDYKHMIITDAKVIPDVYKLENKVAAGRGPIKIVEHYRVANNYVGSILLLQDDAVMDIDGETMQKDLDFAEAFVDGVFPEKIVDAVFKKNSDVLAGASGRLYSRVKNDNTLFNSGKYLNEPLKLDGEILENCEPIFAPSSFDAGFILIHDKNKRRLIAMRDYNSTLAPLMGKPDGAPVDFVPLDNLSSCEIFHIGHYRKSTYYEDNYSMIIKKNGEYYNQTFRATASGTVSACSINKIIGLPADPTCVDIVTYHGAQSYIFIAISDKLYLYDSSNPDEPVTLYLEFDSDVVSMQSIYFYGYMGIVGLKNGKFFIIDTAEAKNILNVKDRILYSSPEGLDIGEIKSVIRKLGRQNN